jgi:hypothetical protein
VFKIENQSYRELGSQFILNMDGTPLQRKDMIHVLWHTGQGRVPIQRAASKLDLIIGGQTSLSKLPGKDFDLKGNCSTPNERGEGHHRALDKGLVQGVCGKGT